MHADGARPCASGHARAPQVTARRHPMTLLPVPLLAPSSHCSSTKVRQPHPADTGQLDRQILSTSLPRLRPTRSTPCTQPAPIAPTRFTRAVALGPLRPSWSGSLRSGQRGRLPRAMPVRPWPIDLPWHVSACFRSSIHRAGTNRIGSSPSSSTLLAVSAGHRANARRRCASTGTAPAKHSPRRQISAYPRMACRQPSPGLVASPRDRARRQCCPPLHNA